MARRELDATEPEAVRRALDRPAEESAVSAHARRIVERSRREAREHGENALGVEHVLLALLSDSRNGAAQTLEELNTTSEPIRRRLDRQRVTDARPGLPPDLAGAEAQVTSRRRPLSTS